LTTPAISATVSLVETRENILQTAAHLFSTLGYAKTSLSQVAKEAGVSKALILWHFESKEQLFRAALQRTLEPYFINVVADLDHLDEVGQIRKLIDLYYEFVDDHLFSIKLVLGLLLREEKHPDDVVARIGQLFRVYSNLLAEIIETGRQKGLFRSNVKPPQEAALIMAVLNGILVQSFLQEASLDPAPLLAHLKTTFIDRLRSTEAAEPPADGAVAAARIEAGGRQRRRVR
jgi:AcrR family transcriptional regulator